MSDIATPLGQELTKRGLWRSGLVVGDGRANHARGVVGTGASVDGVVVWVLWHKPCGVHKRLERLHVAVLALDLTDDATAGVLHGIACEVLGPVDLFSEGTDEGWCAEWAGSERRPARAGYGPTPGEALARLLLAVWEGDDAE